MELTSTVSARYGYWHEVFVGDVSPISKAFMSTFFDVIKACIDLINNKPKLVINTSVGNNEILVVSISLP
jgi:hypothetical protein